MQPAIYSNLTPFRQASMQWAVGSGQWAVGSGQQKLLGSRFSQLDAFFFKARFKCLL